MKGVLSSWSPPWASAAQSHKDFVRDISNVSQNDLSEDCLETHLPTDLRTLQVAHGCVRGPPTGMELCGSIGEALKIKGKSLKLVCA